MISCAKRENLNESISMFLMYRSLLNSNLVFSNKIKTNIADINFPRVSVSDSNDLYTHLKKEVEKYCKDGKAALMLSGGMDSAILASFMPKGSQTYTFKCVVPGESVIDETSKAKIYAEKNNLKNDVIEMNWEDFENFSPILMKNKGAPIHSIEVQIYKAALKAKEDGFESVIFGENADIIFGGMDGLLAKDWTFGEFVERYSYIMPYKVLINPVMNLEPFFEFENHGYINAHEFINKYFRMEALSSYKNACETAGVNFVGPYSTTKMAKSIDYERIRSGDTKYLVREVYKRIYGNEKMSPKIPMPRPMDKWLKDYNGPVKRSDMFFHENCAVNMSGDQKWMIYSVEKFLNVLDSIK